MPRSLVSVVLTTRNRHALLRRAVSSVLQQTYSEIELVVVDDGSTDATESYLSALSECEPRIRVIRNSEPSGAQVARNMGARAAAGDVLAFMDDDIAWPENKIEAQVTKLRHDTSFVYCPQSVVGLSGAPVIEGSPAAALMGAAGLLVANYIGTYTILIRRWLFDRIGGFDPVMPRLQDWDFALRAAVHTRFGFAGDVVARGEVVDGGISSDSVALRRAADLMSQRANTVYGLSRAQSGRLHYGLAKYLLADGVTRDAKRMALASIHLSPGYLPAYIVLLLASARADSVLRGIRALRRRIRRG